MSSYKGFAEAFTIFAKYCDEKVCQVFAEHDEIFATNVDGVSEEDRKRLKELGWERFEQGNGGFKKIV